MILTRDQIAAPQGLVIRGTRPHPASALAQPQALLATVFELGHTVTLELGPALELPDHWRCTIRTVEVTPHLNGLRIVAVVAIYVVRDELCVMWVTLPDDTARDTMAESARRFFATATPVWAEMRTLGQLLSSARPSGAVDA